MSEVFIGRKGRFVKLEETIDGFGGIYYYYNNINNNNIYII
jgi:F0F1-type ATP synthase beta subunit